MAVEGPHTPVMLRCKRLPVSHNLLHDPLRPMAAFPPQSQATERHGGVRGLAGHMGWWNIAERCYICWVIYIYMKIKIHTYETGI